MPGKIMNEDTDDDKRFKNPSLLRTNTPVTVKKLQQRRTWEKLEAEMSDDQKAIFQFRSLAF